MIKTFKCKETEKLFRREHSRKLPTNLQRTALKKLVMLHAAPNLQALTIPPSNHLEKLQKIGKVSTAFGSMINGEYVLSGRMGMRVR